MISWHLQVVTGGQYDVDVTLEGPRGDVIYRQIKTQFDSHQFTAKVCVQRIPLTFRML